MPPNNALHSHHSLKYDSRGISAPWVQSKVGDNCLVLSAYGYHLQNKDFVAEKHGHCNSHADIKF